MMIKKFIDSIKFHKISAESGKSHPFEHLNAIYKDHELQFDQYGNPLPVKPKKSNN